MTHVWSISYLDADGVISFRVERQIEPFVFGREGSNSKEHGTSCHDQHYPHQKRIVTPENVTLYIESKGLLQKAKKISSGVEFACKYLAVCSALLGWASV